MSAIPIFAARAINVALITTLRWLSSEETLSTVRDILSQTVAHLMSSPQQSEILTDKVETV